jgi:hypothetical protein
MLACVGVEEVHVIIRGRCDFAAPIQHGDVLVGDVGGLAKDLPGPGMGSVRSRSSLIAGGLAAAQIRPWYDRYGETPWALEIDD